MKEMAHRRHAGRAQHVCDDVGDAVGEVVGDVVGGVGVSEQCKNSSVRMYFGV